VIKAAGTSNGRPLLILGLSGENMTRLMAGEPIRLDTAPLGLPTMTVLILGGRTEEDIANDLRTHGIIAPTTKTHGLD
jgi:hypothetical protein